jgi:hypothetical protein
VHHPAITLAITALIHVVSIFPSLSHQSLAHQLFQKLFFLHHPTTLRPSPIISRHISNMADYSSRVRLNEHPRAGYMARYKPESYDVMAMEGVRNFRRTLHPVLPGDHPFVAA